MNITPHFKVQEFRCKDNTPYPTEWIFSRLKPLCLSLEAIREECGGNPIIITSGYRTPEHNSKVSRATKSQHIRGTAADFKIKGMTGLEIKGRIEKLIEEGAIPDGGLGTYKRFPNIVHYDQRGERARWHN